MQRLPFVDWARGFAVVAMVLWHSGDAWLRQELHTGESFFFLRFVGGLAAPAFLMLAGMGMALGARPTPDSVTAGSRLLTGSARGAEIIVLGAPRRRLTAAQAAVFGKTVDYILRHATCRVLVTASEGA